ncbi:MAG: hypothetical protein J1E64_07510 [Acetatifactor sp.]|nr:hypothetical protein [Acetatifactor sp.]
MLDIVLNLLSILGIVLLVLLGVVFVVLLLVLFFPFTYRVKGQKDAEEMSIQVKAHWLFGLLRVHFAYPDPGKLTVKALFFKVFDSGEMDRKGDDSKIAPDKSPGKTVRQDIPKEETVPREEITREKDDGEQADRTEVKPQEEYPKEADISPEEPVATGKKSFHDKISAKYVKIKYTILKIYDRIKDVWENISFYQKLLTEENTRELFKHACFRVGKILKGIRPRKLKADVIFGAASPDTTGYLYGVYCMLSPKLGKDIHVIPDFAQAIFEGRLYAAGHITVIQVLLHGIVLLLDKRLRIFLRRLKKHGASKNKQ